MTGICAFCPSPAALAGEAALSSVSIEAVANVTGDRDRRPASFDKLRMREFIRAIKNLPHPELVEGRAVRVQHRGVARHRGMSLAALMAAAGAATSRASSSKLLV